MRGSLHDRVTGQYYRTTAARAHMPTRSWYGRAADGLLLRLRPWLPQERDLVCLDLACGCGELIYLLEREGMAHTIGVDLCKEELDHARPFVRGELIHSDLIEHLRRTASDSVDLITAFNILEHLPKNALGEALNEARRVLRPGGALLAMVPNAVSPFGGMTRHWDITHEWAFAPNNFRQLAALTGFAPEVEFRECGPTVHGVRSAVRYALWQVIRAGVAAWFLIEVGQLKGGIYTMDMLVRLRKPAGARSREEDGDTFAGELLSPEISNG